MHLMELLGEWVMLNLVSIHLETVLVLVQDWCMVCDKHAMAQKSFWTHPMELLGDVGHVESHFFLVETMLVSMQDRCMVCAL